MLIQCIVVLIIDSTQGIQNKSFLFPHWYVVTASLLTKVIVWALVGKVMTVQCPREDPKIVVVSGELGPSSLMSTK